MAATWHIRPSQIAAELLIAELPDVISSHDWYAFDVAAAIHYHELRSRAIADIKGQAPALPRQHHPAIPLQPVVRESGELLHMVGTEIPPWER